MCKYVTFYTLSFLSPTPPIQYHLLPFSSSYFILTSIQPSDSSHKCYLLHKSECTKELFSPLPFYQFSTNCPCSSSLPVVLHPHITSTIRLPLFVFSLLFHHYIPPLEGARGRFLSLPRHHISPLNGSPRERNMCKEECYPLVPMTWGLSPIPLSFASKPSFYRFLHRCIILWVNYLYTLPITIVQDSYKLPISSL